MTFVQDSGSIPSPGPISRALPSGEQYIGDTQVPLPTACSNMQSLTAILGALALFGTCKALPRFGIGTTYNSNITSESISELSKSLGTPVPPCCSDGITSIACRRLQEHNPIRFAKRCEGDADFSFIQCCNTCGLESAASRYETIFQQNEKSPACLDRHEPEFCKRFLKKEGVWGKSQWSCDGQYASLAFRICKKTCNYCRRDIYRTPIGYFMPTPCGKEHRLVPNPDQLNFNQAVGDW